MSTLEKTSVKSQIFLVDTSTKMASTCSMAYVPYFPIECAMVFIPEVTEITDRRLCREQIICQKRNTESTASESESESELLLVTHQNDNHSPGPGPGLTPEK